MDLPAYTGPIPTITPPFNFRNMTVCVFPLRAQLDTLQGFCDRYLNIIPGELGYFRVSAPYVSLMMLDYGQMSVPITNLGWFSQREVGFSIPLEWYKIVDGRWVFHDWASVFPFIYVDDQMSMTLGRTVLGWPKALVKTAPLLTGWMQDPGGSTTDVALSAMVFPRAYAGEEMEERIFMRVQSPMNSELQIPPNPASPWLPWNLLSNVMTAATKFGTDFGGVLAGLGLMPLHPGSTPDNFARKAAKAYQMGFPLSPNLVANTVNLKQFRRADAPSEYAYQAVVNGPIKFTAFNRAAMLGQPAILAGDPSGGYEIDLVRWPSFPIIETLGLRVESTSQVEGASAARLKPVFPFWYDVNMQYDRAHRIAWRADDGRWHDEQGEPSGDPPRGARDKQFNTSMSAGAPVVTGPFVFRELTLRAFPLLAKAACLTELLRTRLNQPLEGTGERFDVWTDADSEHPDRAADTAYVYLAIIDWGPVSSETNDIGDWAETGAMVYVPVRRFVAGKLVGVGLYAVLACAQGTTQACTLSELYGITTTPAEFTVPPGPWNSGMDQVQQGVQSLLRVDTETLPSVGEGQELRMRTLFEVTDAGNRATAEATEPSDQAQAFCELLRHETERKARLGQKEKQALRVLALELLGTGRPFHLYTLKEFLDGGADPTKACYQALLQIPIEIQELSELQEISGLSRLHIHEYPYLPVVRALGLMTRDVRLGDGATVYTTEAVRPFTLRARVRLGNGRRVHHRVDQTWITPAASADQDRLSAPMLPRMLEEIVSLKHRCHLKATVRRWQIEPEQLTKNLVKDVFQSYFGPSELWPDSGPLAWDEAHAALSLQGPQATLESILSREWEDRSTTSRRAVARAKLDSDLRARLGIEISLESMTAAANILVGMGWVSDLAYQSLWVLLLALDRLRTALEPMDDGQEDLDEAWKLLSSLEGYNALGAVLRNAGKIAVEFRHTPDFPPLEDIGGLGELQTRIQETTRDNLEADAWRRKDALEFAKKLLKIVLWQFRVLLEAACDQVLAKQRKPDHCVPIETGGTLRHALFPANYVWHDDWYVGPPRTQDEPPVILGTPAL
jgi:hypothetical protein